MSSNQSNSEKTDLPKMQSNGEESESIGEDGNSWADQQNIEKVQQPILGGKAEEYLKESANIEDLPDDNDISEAETNKARNASVKDDNNEESDEVLEPKEEQVPGYDLGRNKVQ